jgi:hypothetical protein
MKMKKEGMKAVKEAKKGVAMMENHEKKEKGIYKKVAKMKKKK